MKWRILFLGLTAALAFPVLLVINITTPEAYEPHHIDVYWGVREGVVMDRDAPYGVWITLYNRGQYPEEIWLTITTDAHLRLWVQDTDSATRKVNTGMSRLSAGEERRIFYPCINHIGLYKVNGTLMGWEGSKVESELIHLGVISSSEDEGVLKIVGPIVTGN